MDLVIETDDLSGAAVVALVAEHLTEMGSHTPAESVHALPLDSLRAADVTVWTAWSGAELLGCAALRELDPTHGEIKSMRTTAAARGQGVGRALLLHLIEVAGARGYTRLSLETGSNPPFEAARQLYRSHGFVDCPPFGDYTDDPWSTYLTLPLPAGR